MRARTRGFRGLRRPKVPRPNTWAIAELLAEHAGRVEVSNPLRTRAIAAAKTKTDQIDAATLAQLLAADYLPEVWQPDPATRALRRLIAHRAGLVRGRTGARNRVHAICARRLLSAPVTDLFGVTGRAWLGRLELAADERLALDRRETAPAIGCLLDKRCNVPALR